MKISIEDQQNLLLKKNVVGVGIGTKISKGIDTNKKCAVILVRRKISLNDISINDQIPKTLGKFKKIKTDVIECGDLIPLNIHQEKYRPLVGGISCSPQGFGVVGTIGLPLVYQNNKPVMLSNTHVIAPYWENSRLEEHEIEDFGIHVGTNIYQPGTADTSKISNIFRHEKNIIGSLLKWTKLIPGEDNLLDAAIATVEVDAEQEILGLGKYSKLLKPKVGMKIKKSGRTSQITESKIKLTDFIVNIDYPGLGRVLFKNQIGIEPSMVSPGDSGSAIINEENEIVGLAFAGSSSFSVAMPIQEVFKYFNLTLNKEGKKTPGEEKAEKNKELVAIFIKMVKNILIKLGRKLKKRK